MISAAIEMERVLNSNFGSSNSEHAIPQSTNSASGGTRSPEARASPVRNNWRHAPPVALLGHDILYAAAVCVATLVWIKVAVMVCRKRKVS